MDIDLIKSKLLVKYPLFGSIIANTSFIEDVSTETCETDGKNIYYNIDFIASITKDQQVFALAHEISHIAFDHITRLEGKDREIWNVATDAVINALLIKDGLTAIKNIVEIKDAIYYDAEELYNKLLKEKKSKNPNKKKEGSNGKGKEGKTKEHTHSLWEKALEKQKKANKNDMTNKQSKGEKEKKEIIDKLTKLGERKIFKQNKIERQKQLEEFRKALATKSHSCGKNTNEDKRNLQEIGVSKPLLDWRMILKEASYYNVDWSYQNAEIENGIIMAHLEEIPRSEVEIVLDTSGSIKEILLRNFLRECKNIFQNAKIKVGCFDTKFYGFTEIKKVSDIDTMPFYGGGGTNFQVAVNAFTKRVENKIIFTDGYADMPNTNIDIIWIVFGNKKINPRRGKVIYIDDKYLEKLYNSEIIIGKSK